MKHALAISYFAFTCRLSVSWFAIKAQRVAGGIAEGGDEACAVGCVGVGVLEDLAAVRLDLGDELIDIFNPDGGEDAGVLRRLQICDKGAAHAARIIEAGVVGVAPADIPAEDVFVKLGRLAGVSGGDFEVTEARARKRMKIPHAAVSWGRIQNDCGFGGH